MQLPSKLGVALIGLLLLGGIAHAQASGQGYQGPVQYNNNCIQALRFGTMSICRDTVLNEWFYWDYRVNHFVLDPDQFQHLNPLHYGLQCDMQRLIDTTVTAGSNLLLSANGDFTPNMVGYHVLIKGAGAVSTGPPAAWLGQSFFSTITKVDSANQAELANNVITSVSSQNQTAGGNYPNAVVPSTTIPTFIWKTDNSTLLNNMLADADPGNGQTASAVINFPASCSFAISNPVNFQGVDVYGAGAGGDFVGPATAVLYTNTTGVAISNWGTTSGLNVYGPWTPFSGATSLGTNTTGISWANNTQNTKRRAQTYFNTLDGFGVDIDASGGTTQFTSADTCHADNNFIRSGLTGIKIYGQGQYLNGLFSNVANCTFNNNKINGTIKGIDCAGAGQTFEETDCSENEFENNDIENNDQLDADGAFIWGIRACGSDNRIIKNYIPTVPGLALLIGTQQSAANVDTSCGNGHNRIEGNRLTGTPMAVAAPALAVSTASWSSGVVTVTLSATPNPPLYNDQAINIASASPSGYNTDFNQVDQIIAVPGPDNSLTAVQFQYRRAVNPGAYSSGMVVQPNIGGLRYLNGNERLDTGVGNGVRQEMAGPVMNGSVRVEAKQTPAIMSLSCIDNPTQATITCPSSTPAAVFWLCYDSDNQPALPSNWISIANTPTPWQGTDHLTGQYLRGLVKLTPWCQSFDVVACLDTVANCKADNTKWKTVESQVMNSPNGYEAFTIGGPGPNWLGTYSLPTATTGVVDASAGLMVAHQYAVDQFNRTINGTGSKPSLTAGCSGAGSAIATGGTDNGGYITTQTSASTTCTMSFANAWPHAPSCSCSDANASTSPLGCSVDPVNTNTTQMVIKYASGTNLVWHYSCQ